METKVNAKFNDELLKLLKAIGAELRIEDALFEDASNWSVSMADRIAVVKIQTKELASWVSSEQWARTLSCRENKDDDINWVASFAFKILLRKVEVLALNFQDIHEELLRLQIDYNNQQDEEAVNGN